MTPYHAPAVVGERSIEGRLRDLSEIFLSDAEIKHGARPVAGYAVPSITARADLQGSLDGFSHTAPSDAEIKHAAQPLS